MPTGDATTPRQVIVSTATTPKIPRGWFLPPPTAVTVAIVVLWVLATPPVYWVITDSSDCIDIVTRF